MYMSYLQPLPDDLVTNDFYATSAELELEDRFFEI